MTRLFSKLSVKLSFDSAILNNEYVKRCVSNKTRNSHSLSYLIYNLMSQSDCIKLGIALEKVISEFILENSSLIDIKPKNIKFAKEKDHLFKDDIKKIIYYAELKSNLNLDTEKSKATSIKVLEIHEDLKKMYDDYEIKTFLIGTRYYKKDIIPGVIHKKYTPLKNSILGINEYLEELGISHLFDDEEDYKIFLNKLSKAMFK